MGEYDRYTPEETKEQLNFEARLASEEGCLSTCIMELELTLPEDLRDQAGRERPQTNAGEISIDVFISHSSGDTELAGALVELLRSALPGLHPKRIRCTSVAGYKLTGGSDTNNKLREELREARVFIGILTNQSLHSTYVLFELGARWGANSQFTPLLAAGLRSSDLKAPLSGLHAHSCDTETDLHQMLDEIGKSLSLERASPDVYDRHLKKIADLSRVEGKRRLEAVPTPAQQSRGFAKPRIEQAPPRQAKLYLDELDQWTITTGPGEWSGVVVPFYYDPKSEARPEIYVRAHLVFLDKESGDRIVVPAACWIGEYLNAAVLKPGDEKCVLLLAFNSQGEAITCKSRREHYNEFQSGVGLVDYVPMPKTPQTVEITLLWNNDRDTLTYKFEIPDRRRPGKV